MELASRHPLVFPSVRIQAPDEVTQSHSGLHVRILIDNHRKHAGQEVLPVVIRQLVRYPGDAVLWIELLEGPLNPSRTSTAVVNARKIG